MGVAAEKAKLEPNLAAIHPTQFGKLMPKRGNPGLRFRIGLGQAEETAD